MEDARWFGPTSRVEITEQSDGLLVRIVATKRKGQLAIALIVAFVLSVYFSWHGSWIADLIVLVMALLFVAGSFGDHSGEIHVSKSYLIGEGKSHVRLAWSEIRALQYSGGGEDEPAGLYGRVGRWRSVCVMANLNREQTEEIIAAIYHRFPNVKMADDGEPLGARLRSFVDRLRGRQAN